MRRQLQRLENCNKAAEAVAPGENIAVPTPGMQSVMDKKLSEVEEPFSFRFTDKGRSRVEFAINVNGKKATRCATLHATEPECDCGATDIDESPCACLLFAAKKAGMSTDGFVIEADTVFWWMHQYEPLPKYEVPGTEAIMLLPPCELTPLPPVSFPLKAGRPTVARMKKAIESTNRYKKRKLANFNAKPQAK